MYAKQMEIQSMNIRFVRKAFPLFWSFLKNICCLMSNYVERLLMKFINNEDVCKDNVFLYKESLKGSAI